MSNLKDMSLSQLTEELVKQNAIIEYAKKTLSNATNVMLKVKEELLIRQIIDEMNKCYLPKNSDPEYVPKNEK